MFPLEVKSIITHPSPGLTLEGPGFYEISGLAWSGNGRIRSVEVSADGGKSWAPAVLNEPVLPKALTRFRAAWQWNGGPAVLQSRATDDTGMVQPTRAQFARSAACAASITTTRSRAGASTRRGRPPMRMLEPSRDCVRRRCCSPRSLTVPALAQTPQFGQPIAPADLAPWDISIGPDGVGLPAGRGTVAQGEAVYAAKCQACHGEKGAGRPNDRLVGGQGSLAAGKSPVKTVGSYWPYATTLFDYVRRAMP